MNFKAFLSIKEMNTVYLERKYSNYYFFISLFVIFNFGFFIELTNVVTNLIIQGDAWFLGKASRGDLKESIILGIASLTSFSIVFYKIKDNVDNFLNFYILFYIPIFIKSFLFTLLYGSLIAIPLRYYLPTIKGTLIISVILLFNFLQIYNFIKIANTYVENENK